MHVDNQVEVPYFIKVRGCFNCEVPGQLEAGRALHEVSLLCMLHGCVAYDPFTPGYCHDVNKPYLDPEDAAKFAIEKRPDLIEQAVRYCKKIKKLWGKCYEAIEVSLDDVIAILQAEKTPKDL
jgi:hypothetical protein